MDGGLRSSLLLTTLLAVVPEITQVEARPVGDMPSGCSPDVFPRNVIDRDHDCGGDCRPSTNHCGDWDALPLSGRNTTARPGCSVNVSGTAVPVSVAAFVSVT
jgi:hypothetical protein